MLDYPKVSARLNQWGLLGQLIVARTTRLSKDAAILYCRAITNDPKLTVRVKRGGSWASLQRNSITLSCDGQRRVSFSSVLHECAHILDYRKGKLRNGPHGESFCRTYARLLKETL
jgi:hypothetical protein